MCYHLSQEDNFCFAFFLFDQHATFPALPCLSKESLVSDVKLIVVANFFTYI